MRMFKNVPLSTILISIVASVSLPLDAAQKESKNIIGIIPVSTIEWEGGCTHYLMPIKNPSDYEKRIIFHWGYPALDRPNGKCVHNCLPYMNVNGKTVPVRPLTKWPEDLMKKNSKVGEKFSEIYQLGSISMRFDNQITFVCPPRDEECEVTKFRGILTVTDGERKETYQTTGECGV